MTLGPSYDAWLEPPDPKEPLMDDCECGGLDPDCEECNGEGEIEVQECDTCRCARCRCDDDYEAWKESQWDH